MAYHARYCAILLRNQLRECGPYADSSPNVEEVRKLCGNKDWKKALSDQRYIDTEFQDMKPDEKVTDWMEGLQENE
ncbi:MAG: hypothetical protein Q9172_003951 [Xanthocarpia lactea]